MPKQLINTIGVMIVVAIVAVGVAFVAVPLVLQAFTTFGQTAIVAQTNSEQEAQVAYLEEQSGDAATLEAELATLQDQIPATPLVYTISELISEAAIDTGVSVTGITPNAPAPYVGGAAAPVADGSAASQAAVTGRAQIPVQITVLAETHADIVAFIDRLREGPRLLGEIDAVISSRGGADATINALAFADIAETGASE